MNEANEIIFTVFPIILQNTQGFYKQNDSQSNKKTKRREDYHLNLFSLHIQWTKKKYENKINEKIFMNANFNTKK